MNNLNIKEGTVEFTVNANKVKFDNHQIVPLAQFSPQEGSIFIVKDADDKLKFFHVYLGKGRTDVVYDVTKLDSNTAHHFAFTWSVSAKEIKIYIDGKEVARTNIKY